MVRVTARASREGIEGVHTDAAGVAWLQVRVSTAPEKGRANEAVARLLARALDVAPSAVTLLSGAGSRHKRFLVRGDPAVLAPRAGCLGRDRGAQTS